jgi:hypothetical protein
VSRLNIEMCEDDEGTHCSLCEHVLTPSTPFLFVSPASDTTEDPAGEVVCLGCARELWEFAKKEATG